MLNPKSSTSSFPELSLFISWHKIPSISFNLKNYYSDICIHKFVLDVSNDQLGYSYRSHTMCLFLQEMPYTLLWHLSEQI